MLTEHYESNKSYDAFDSNAHLVMAEVFEWNKLYNAFDAFDFSVRLVIA